MTRAHEDVPWRLAAWQVASVPADCDANLAALDAAAADASARGVRLLVTPEMFLTGYNLGDRLRDLAAGRPLERVSEIAARHDIAIVAGGPEPAGSGAIYNAAYLVDRTGDVKIRYRKVHLYGELDAAVFTPGRQPSPVADIDGVRVALAVCFDVEFPHTVAAAAAAGAEVVAVPTANMQPYRVINDHVISVRAYENSVYVAYANQFGPDGDITYLGLSVIADPEGTAVARAGETGAQLLIADVDRVVLDRARQLNEYVRDRCAARSAEPVG